jgi:hypothetical protein
MRATLEQDSNMTVEREEHTIKTARPSRSTEDRMQIDNSDEHP